MCGHRGSDAVSDVLVLSDEVTAAIADGRPVVALETTLVSHGFPHPEGADVARTSEARVRAQGAVPATIGVVDGVVRVGLGDAELERFSAAGADARKLGPRDIAACMAQGALGATTVGSTLAIAALAGIRFMATGGLGGVHRGYEQQPDISADLAELTHSPVVIVSSGVKSLLDVLRHRGAAGVAVDPGAGLAHRHAAAVLRRRGRAAGGHAGADRRGGGDDRPAALGVRCGGASALLLGRPPSESLDDVEALIEEALAAAAREQVSGQGVTPFVLGYLHENSEGRTAAANKALIVDNATLAAQVAVAYTATASAAFRRPRLECPAPMRTCVRVIRARHPPRRPRRVLRVGGAARRAAAARAAGDRGRRRGAGGLLRGARVRGAFGDGRRAGARAVPAGDRGAAALQRLRRGVQGGLRHPRPGGAGGRAAVDRRGVPRRHRAGAHLRDGRADRGATAARRARAGRAADLDRGGDEQAPGQGRQRVGQARRHAGRPAGLRAGLPASPPGRAHVGRRPGDPGTAQRGGDPHGGRAGAPQRAGAGRRRGPGGGPPVPRAGAQPRSATGAARPGPAIDRVTAGAGPRRALVARARRGRRGARRSRDAADARRRSRRADRRAAPALRRLHAGDALTHARAGRRRPRGRSWPRCGGC